MAPEVWIAFVAASTVLLVIPGPTVMLVVSYALGHGRATAWATVPGVTLGDFTAMTASLLGAGAVLAASASLFTVLKLAGAAYLIWLGINLWRARPNLRGTEPSTEGQARGPIFRHAYVVTALNPKSIVFFVAFVPQFVDAASPAAMQFVILEATFLSLATVNTVLWAALAGGLGAGFRRPAAIRIVSRIGASVLIAAGVVSVFARRTG